MSSQEQLGVALIGAGMIAQSHIKGLSATSLARLDVVVSRSPAKAAHLAQFYSGPAPLFTSDMSKVTENPDIQVVIVATPPSVRIDLISELAQAGKHILLEKPVARTVKEAETVVDICEQAGVSLGVLFQHRMRAPSIAAAGYVAGGSLGALGHVEIAVPLWRDQSYYDSLGRGTYARDGGGVLITQAIHTLDLALSLTGPITSVQAMTATSPLHRMEAEDFAVAGLRFACGAVGSLVATTATFPHGLEVITLHFEHGSLRLDKKRLYLNWRDGRSENNAFETIAPADKYIWHQRVIEDFLDSVRRGTLPLVTGRDALAVHDLIEAIEISSRKASKVEIASR